MFEFIDVKYKEIVHIPQLVIKEGLTVLLGPSGSGKTTVLKMLNKMISPTSGRIYYNGQEMSHLNSVEHRRQVMMLSQTPAMFEGTVGLNLTIPFELQEKAAPGIEALTEVLSRVGLKKDLDEPAQRLSGGEKQRLALARVFLCDPAVFILDEPSSALDNETESAILKMVAGHAQKNGKSIVMVTHSKPVAETFADYIIEMSNGKIMRRRTSDGRDY